MSSVKFPGYGAVRLFINGSTAGLVPEAPIDGTAYVRKDGGWVAESGATANALTFAASGGAAPGSSFDGSAPLEVDYSTVGAIAAAALDTDPTFTANSDLKVPSQKAVNTAIAAAVVGLWDPHGGIDCSGNPNYPAALKGDTYVVTVAGKIGGASGTAVGVGDVIVCFADNAGGDQATVGASWDVVLHAASLVGALLAANNLSDLTSAATARANLGLLSAALHAATDFLLSADNLSDIPAPATALANLGGKSATPNVQAVVSAATVTPTFSNDLVKITAQAAALTLANPTGTAVPSWGMGIRIKDDGTPRAIGYGTQYRALGVTLPTTTVAGKTLYLGLIYNADDTQWDVVAVCQQA